MNLKDAIQSLADKGNRVYSITGKVVEVNGKTCDVDPDNGDATLFDVRLQSEENPNGILITPKVGSSVIVTMISKEAGYIGMFSEVDSISLMGEGNSMIKTDELITQLAKVNMFLTGLKNAISAAPVVAGDGGASFKSSLITALSSLEFPNYSNIKNDKVKHG